MADEKLMCYRVYVDSEVVGTFFSSVQAWSFAGDYYMAGYEFDRVDVRREEY